MPWAGAATSAASSAWIKEQPCTRLPRGRSSLLVLTANTLTYPLDDLGDRETRSRQGATCSRREVETRRREWRSRRSVRRSRSAHGGSAFCRAVMTSLISRSTRSASARRSARCRCRRSTPAGGHSSAHARYGVRWPAGRGPREAVAAPAMAVVIRVRRAGVLYFRRHWRAAAVQRGRHLGGAAVRRWRTDPHPQPGGRQPVVGASGAATRRPAVGRSGTMRTPHLLQLGVGGQRDAQLLSQEHGVSSSAGP